MREVYRCNRRLVYCWVSEIPSSSEQNETSTEVTETETDSNSTNVGSK